MDKMRMLKWVNILLLLAFIMTAAGGLFRFFMPSAVPIELFRAFHPKAGLFLVVMAVIHISLNFGWIKSTYFKK